ncbi:hypothetical protein S7711_07804 [Stachybotrys chartarum IBT 7711]|uniref:Rho-GAP domain-containing protein n=1 Tax=Stachybotrys chartarum (strain CBS 109288 / IBT 7711) TaxID=1280523 RepID=A0A084ASQ4_STACB|nr:hypothetical protein S7711_07804 [Stachybotrys chartarum IBT 7711]KFA49663.1 hypothetical protein S40293_01406 [Stachybotrys chartarum IBT 40293]KFA77361.1 hypothetical protein S40288_04338 [Stachybotrys chartarum IBT 40288]
MPDTYPSAGDPNSQPQLPSSFDAPGRMSLGDSAPPPAAPTSAAKADAVTDKSAGDDDNTTPAQGSLDVGNPSQAAAASPEVIRQVGDVLKSEVGVSTLLNRLKQSIGATKEFGLFLKKRSTIEDDHAQSLKKLSRMTQDNMRRADHRQGSFLHGYEETMYMHDRMAENGIQFAVSLHQMHEDLFELASFAERSRKGLKASGLAAEQKVADLEQAMRKSKAKYDSLAEEYDRARTGESKQSGKVFGFKSKSAAQHEEDLYKKVQAADQNYHNSVQLLQSEKAQLESSTRPETIKALLELVKETDAGLTLQMQKFASFNEKLLLSNGLIISPLKSGDAGAHSRSLRQAVASINNDKDFNDFVSSQYPRIAHGSGEVKYERNPVLGPPGQHLNHQTSQVFNTMSYNNQGATRENRSNTLTSFTSPPVDSAPSHAPPPPSSGFPAQTSPLDHPPLQAPPGYAHHGRTGSQGNILPSSQGSYGPSSNATQGHSRFGNGMSISTQGPPQLGALPFQGSQSPIQPPTSQFSHSDTRSPGGFGASQPASMPLQSRASPPATATTTAPSGPPKPVFGVPLSRLYERDNIAVPMVVQQCIQAVELYGLELEGIYRQSGSLTHIQKLKAMFDTDSSNKALDFRNPENFYEDVNSVTGLLKQFFRDLPDPLLTTEHHNAFIDAARHDDNIVRRDSLHAIINSLPDPNYATLRALALHLYRVMDKAHINRMNCHNLAVIFGPTLMGTTPATPIEDAGRQIRVIDTILQNTYQIFDED